MINQVTLQVPWEEALLPGPVGEYLEVVDYDPASGCFYAPVDLNDPHLLAAGRPGPLRGQPAVPPADGLRRGDDHDPPLRACARPPGPLVRRTSSEGDGEVRWKAEYVPRLRIYPARPARGQRLLQPGEEGPAVRLLPGRRLEPAGNLPGGMVFTCLSHDIIAHETTHALLDGLHRYFIEPSNPDVLAFHEAFADIVALFQHFSLPEVLRTRSRKTRGDLTRQNLLGELAQQFGAGDGPAAGPCAARSESRMRTASGSRWSR